jgi:1-deoxy-D-xylulose-5-phosphate reductoisomerase
MPVVLNAANEVAVDAFLNQAIGFHQISQVIRQAMERHDPIDKPKLGEILDADDRARKSAAAIISVLSDR